MVPFGGTGLPVLCDVHAEGWQKERQGEGKGARVKFNLMKEGI